MKQGTTTVFVKKMAGEEQILPGSVVSVIVDRAVYVENWASNNSHPASRL